ncbi:SMC family ATPase [Candidatus Gracilibacteria bacterium]|nr:SMC family ATPase [Candidatus Gracilibacteria bacterium]
MYPHKLYLKNFLSYGNSGVEIDFSHYKTLLLVGKNGSGKSSILDALLWAIWGKTRTGTDTDIMHSGSSDMEVRLDFVVNEATYRVIRKRSKKGKGFVSLLELQSLTEPITVLTDATISQTQDRINALVGLDYELLISSAFLRQGHAQEFTQKTPGKRKQMLAAMLGLDRYVVLHEQAKSHLHAAEVERDQVATQTQTLQAEQDRYQTQAQEYHGQLSDPAELSARKDSVSKQLKEIEHQQQTQREQQIQVANWSAEKTKQENKVLSLQTQITKLQQQKTELSSQISVTTFDRQVLQDIESQFELYQDIFTRYQQYQQRILNLEKQLSQTTQQYQATLSDLHQQQSTLPPNKTTITGADLEKLSTDIELLRTQQVQVAEKIATSEHILSSIQKEGTTIKDKKTKLSELDHHCPLCEQDIDDSHKEKILNTYETERTVLLSKYTDEKALRDQLIIQRTKLTDEIVTKDAELKQNRQDLQIAEQLLTKRASLDQQIAQATKHHQTQTQALEQELQQTNNEQSALQFDQNHWEHLQQQRKALRALSQEAEKQSHILQQLSLLDHEINLVTHQVTETEQAIKETTQLLTNAQPLENDVPDHYQELKQAYEALVELELASQKIRTLYDHSVAEEARTADQLHKLEERRITLLSTIQSQTLLVEALSNKGIPNMIIEESIPRLEHYTNEVLSFLSDNTMTIRLSLTRPSKVDREAQIETLDILIGDSFGTRAYELFSGGEAFRIDIALRIALTQLLTEHTSGKVDFLVIDEGFGSQDDTGCDHIAQIIHRLEKLFHLIILITHVDQLKETFPDRLLIKKGPQGSEVSVDNDD